MNRESMIEEIVTLDPSFNRDYFGSYTLEGLAKLLGALRQINREKLG